MMILKVTKKQGFTPSLEDTCLSRVNLTPLSPAFLGLK